MSQFDVWWERSNLPEHQRSSHEVAYDLGRGEMLGVLQAALSDVNAGIAVGNDDTFETALDRMLLQEVANSITIILKRFART